MVVNKLCILYVRIFKKTDIEFVIKVYECIKLQVKTSLRQPISCFVAVSVMKALGAFPENKAAKLA